MNSVEITNILSTNVSTRKYFVGVFPCDYLPTFEKNCKPKILIANFSPSTSRGTHWCCCYISNISIEWFDPSGISLKFNPYFQNFIRRNRRKKMVYNTNQLQAKESDTCALYCLLFTFVKSKGATFKKILAAFSTNCANNDRRVYKLVNRIFK